ncbi:MAG TPA: hypothetical protein VMH35_20575 [Streptosporangiaceae bacterium]|nr:hypothetical protein [Streptosporangiaceae bacterium]
MRRQLSGFAARAGRAVRGLWPDRNPLRRGLDRAEALGVAGLCLAFLAAAPLAALTVGHLSYRVASATVHAEQSWRQVPAVLLATAQNVPAGTVRARWRAPDGARRAGPILVPPGAKAGSTVPVWVDQAGRLTGTPLEGSVTAQAGLAAVTAVALLGLLVWGGGLLLHGLLEQRRLAAWDADWQITEPEWTAGH